MFAVNTFVVVFTPSSLGPWRCRGSRRLRFRDKLRPTIMAAARPMFRVPCAAGLFASCCPPSDPHSGRGETFKLLAVPPAATFTSFDSKFTPKVLRESRPIDAREP